MGHADGSLSRSDALCGPASGSGSGTNVMLPRIASIPGAPAAGSVFLRMDFNVIDSRILAFVRKAFYAYYIAGTQGNSRHHPPR
jgi:hypothetical protein